MNPNKRPPGPQRIFRLINFALLLAAAVAVISILIVLYTDADTFTLFGTQVQRWSIASLVIVLLFLLLLRIPFREGVFSARAFLLHPAFVFFSIPLMIYLSNQQLPRASDAVSSRYLPLSILREGDFDLDEFPFLQERPLLHYIEYVNGHYVSAYPVGAPVLATPFYLPSAIGKIDPQSELTEELEKLSAATIVALSVMVLYLALCLATDPRTAVVLTLLYALGTSSFSISSQALLQHGASQLSLSCAILFLLKGKQHSRWIGFSGFFLALAVVCRPTDALFALPAGVYVLLHHRREFLRFLLFAIPPVIFQLWYNISYFSDPLHSQFSLIESWTSPILQGLPGVLFSPARGLFFYSPFFLFAIVGMILVWRKGGDPLLRYLSLGLVCNLVLYSKWRTWWGGGTYGPRLLADITPILILFLYPLKGFVLRKWFWKSVFILTGLWSIYAHAVGAFRPDLNFEVYQLPQKKVTGRFPTSRMSPRRLAATYAKDFPRKMIGRIGAPLELSLTANNVGSAVWLAESVDGKGVVYLEWQWFNVQQAIPGTLGQKTIDHDIYPAQSYAFQLRIEPPPRIGNYFLKLNLVCSGVGPFTDFGGHAVRVNVRVKRPIARLWKWTHNPLFFYTKEIFDEIVGSQ